jgi:hypothetical protein
MKQILTIIICIVLFNTSCTQSTTTPTTPPATTNPCGYSTNSNQYIELKINGKTLRNETILLNGVTFFRPICQFTTDPSGRELNIVGTQTVCALDATVVNDLVISINASKSSNFQDPLGLYNNGSSLGSFYYYSSTTGNKKEFTIPKDSLTVTVTSCTADYVSGTFVGTGLEKNTNTLYPLTGSFNNLIRGGF